MWRGLMAAAAVLWAAGGGPAGAAEPGPAAAVGEIRIAVPTGAGTALLPAFVSPGWGTPLPDIRRAVIIVHGVTRNAVDYQATILSLLPEGSAERRTTLVIAPQFVAPADVAAHHLPDTVLRWRWDQWAHGGAAVAPAPVSSFAALDAILGQLADRRKLPNLDRIVLAGFSAGGQLVQRYIAVGHGEAALRGSGRQLSYVVGSPSSYLYFTDQRPLPDGRLGAFAGAAACPDFNRWRYGLAGNTPDYVGTVDATRAAALERAYAARDVTYLVGAADNDPNHRWLDKSCAAEAEGASRYARAVAFFTALRQRAGGAPHQHLWAVPGAKHQAARVLTSPCGRAALLDATGCTGG